MANKGVDRLMQGSPAFWKAYRAALIQEFRLMLTVGDVIGDKLAAATISKIRAIEAHVSEKWPAEALPAFDPSKPTARARRRYG